jgi:ABC-type multidrug transport system ATPase subunit
MDEAERCNEIAYIYLSRLMVKGTPNELKALPEVTPEGSRRVAVASHEPAKALAILKRQKFVLDATLVEAEIHLLIPANADDRTVLDRLQSEGISDASIRPIDPSLEDVFVTLTRSLAKK